MPLARSTGLARARGGSANDNASADDVQSHQTTRREPMRSSVSSRLMSVACLAVAALAFSPARAQITIYEGARLIVGDGTAIENSAFIVQGNQFTQVGQMGQVQAPAGAAR